MAKIETADRQKVENFFGNSPVAASAECAVISLRRIPQKMPSPESAAFICSDGMSEPETAFFG
jgi:hypothetical protein